MCFQIEQLFSNELSLSDVNGRQREQLYLLFWNAVLIRERMRNFGMQKLLQYKTEVNVILLSSLKPIIPVPIVIFTPSFFLVI